MPYPPPSKSKLDKNWHLCARCGTRFYRRGNRPAINCSNSCRSPDHFSPTALEKLGTLPLETDVPRVSTTVAGRAVGYASSAVRRLARDGKIDAVRNARGNWLIDLDSLRRYRAVRHYPYPDKSTSRPYPSRSLNTEALRVSTTTAGREVGYCGKRVREFARDGKIDAVRNARGRWLVDLDSLRRFVIENAA